MIRILTDLLFTIAGVGGALVGTVMTATWIISGKLGDLHRVLQRIEEQTRRKGWPS